MNTKENGANNLSLWAAFGAQRDLLGIVIIFSVFVNLLVLTGPIFALQVYDRVLSSQSQETLVALVILMAFLFLVMGILDHARKRIAARIGERMVSLIEQRVFDSVLLQKATSGQPRTQAYSDLEILRKFFASSVFVALLDLPWFPVFILGISLFHPALGWLSAIGAFLLSMPALWSLLFGASTQSGEAEEFKEAQALARIALADPELNYGIRLKSSVFPQWNSLRNAARSTDLKIQDRRNLWVSVAQTFRMFLQSSIIAMSAYLVIQGQLTAGAIIAAAVLLSRALGPLDLISQNTPTLIFQFAAWKRLSAVLSEPQCQHRTTYALSPGKTVHIDRITVFPPGLRHAALRMVNFDLHAGQSVGIIGPSGAGKSTLARALIGRWPVAGGQICVGGMPIDQVDPEALSDFIGYLPQQLTFLSGTIAQNISRFQKDAEDAMIKASRSAGAHEMISLLPAGYETVLGTETSPLPSGLIQKIGLARAIFGDPSLLVLDEPANNLDAEGLQTLREIIYSATNTGRSVITCTQRPAVLSGCDLVLVLDAGTQKSFEPAQYFPSSTLQVPQHESSVPKYGTGR